MQAQQNYPGSNAADPVADDRRGMATAAMIVGLVSLVIALIPVLGLLAWLSGPVALILGILSLKSSARGRAITGIVTGALCLILPVIAMVVAVAALQAVGEEVQQNYEREAAAQQSLPQPPEGGK